MYINPYSMLNKEGKWLKANFHTHAGTGPNTCGSHNLIDVIKGYEEAEYDILTISNHDLFTRTTGLSQNLKLIQGVEYSHDPHMLTIGVEDYFNYDHQTAINKTIHAGGFVILCHPHWIHKEYWSNELIDSLSGYTGIEVIAPLIYRLEGSGLAIDTWDRLLTQGKLVFGFSNDDFHQWRDLGKGYNVIYSQSNNENDIKLAIESGCFFASTGVYLDTITFTNNKIYVRAKYPIDTYITQFTYQFYGENGKLLKTVYADDAEYTLTNEKYVRIQVIGENGSMMFMQPIYDDDYLKKP